MARKFSTRRGRRQDPRIVKLIEMAGGNRACAEHFRCNEQAVTNWKTRGFPPETYRRFIDLIAPPELWGMHDDPVPTKSPIAAE